ncbi:MAG: MBL fold metallo-hydrolase [Bacteroidetes bacterium]|nr:MBL fold metallo-hydrolase [Bacteroidota bacterium]
MEIQFCGADKTVTGSSHLIRLKNGKQILLDCGLYQGGGKEMFDFNTQWFFKPSSIDILVLSHAHIDHSGKIPKLVKDGFRGKIYCTSATRDLCAIMLLDSAKIQESDAKSAQKRGNLAAKPLYDEFDVKNALKLFRTVGYDKWFYADEAIKVLFKDAGHILGSASITLDIMEGGKQTILGFTGDIGRWDRPILKDPEPMPECEFLISESTYGGITHEDTPQETGKLLKAITDTCIKNKGKLLIPAFSIGRTQEILYKLDQLYISRQLPEVPVYLDSPLSMNATEIYKMHYECMDEDIEQFLKSDDNPFGWKHLHYITDKFESKLLNEKQEPCVIISASGMAEAGRIKHHIFHNIEDAKNTILIVGYCAKGTLGEKLVQKPEFVKIFGIEKKVNAQIEIIGSMSAHADDIEIRKFLANQKLAKKIFLVHGDEKRQLRLKENLLNNGFGEIYIPSIGEIVTL